MHAALLCLAAIVTAGPTLAETKLRIAVERDYPSWNYRDVNGALVGFDIDISSALCARIKSSCEIMATDWDGIIPGLLAHKYDLIVDGMGITEKRKQQVAFTRRYQDSISQFVGKKGAYTNFSQDGLAGKRIGVQRGTIQYDFLAKNYPESEITIFDKAPDAELGLLDGRIDLLLASKVTSFIGLLKRPEAANYALVGPEFKGGVLGEGNGIALREDDPKLLEQLNVAIGEIITDGTYARINAKYFPFSILSD
jgi:polar amino acid transport system substrate-binding protein/arginine/ornithine transport system substrate-binding protein